MGYYTSYYLEAKVDTGEFTDAMIADIDFLLKTWNIIGDALDEGELYKDNEAVWPTCDVAKWYDHDEDMARLASLYPEITFHLSGCGEEPLDIWDSYYKDRNMEYCPYVRIKPERIKWD